MSDTLSFLTCSKSLTKRVQCGARAVMCLLGTLCLYACSSAPPTVTSPPSPAQIKEPAQTQEPALLSSTLIDSLRGVDVILVGETHDHPQHHSIQAELIRALSPRSVAFEMLNASQAEVASSLFLSPEEGWDEALSWTARGWPPFSLYQPVFMAARDVKAKLVAAHPDRATLQPLMLGQELPTILIDGLKLNQPLPQSARAELEAEIVRSHCGYAPKEMIGPMVTAQRLKDAWMARALLAAPKPVVMIVGRGHTQASRGIPWALELLNDSPSPVSWRVVSLTSAEGASPSEKGPVKVIKTKPHRTDDPCERFKKQLKGMGKHKG